VITSFVVEQTEIEDFRFEKYVIYGGPLLLFSAGLHLLVSEMRSPIVKKQRAK
jgi:hypothetical protein